MFIVRLIECILQKVISEEKNISLNVLCEKLSQKKKKSLDEQKNKGGVLIPSLMLQMEETINRAEAGITLTLKGTISVQLMFIYETISCNSLA